MSRGVSPVGQFRNFAGPKPLSSIDASQDPLRGCLHQYLIPRPVSLARTFQAPQPGRPGSEIRVMKVLLIPSAARALFGGYSELPLLTTIIPIKNDIEGKCLVRSIACLSSKRAGLRATSSPSWEPSGLAVVMFWDHPLRRVVDLVRTWNQD